MDVLPKIAARWISPLLTADRAVGFFIFLDNYYVSNLEAIKYIVEAAVGGENITFKRHINFLLFLFSCLELMFDCRLWPLVAPLNYGQ